MVLKKLQNEILIKFCMILESLPAYFTDKLIRRIESIKKKKEEKYV